MLGSEAEFFVRRLGDVLAAKWERPYSVVMGWVRARLSNSSGYTVVCTWQSNQVEEPWDI